MCVCVCVCVCVLCVSYISVCLHCTLFQRSTFHGSLRKSPKPTSADLVEEDDRHTPQRTVDEPSKPQEEHKPVKTTVKDTAKKTLDEG